MAVLGNYKQQTNERIRYALDFSNRLASGETLSSATVAVEVVSGSTSTPLAESVGDRVLGSTSIQVFMENGVDGVVYCVNVEVTTSSNEVIEHEFLVTVEDIHGTAS